MECEKRRGDMRLQIKPKRFGIKITAFIAVFALSLQPLGFVLNHQAGAITGSEVVYDALPSVSPATNYPSQAFQATSTSEFGDYIHLGGANRVLDKVTVTMSNWAKYSDYSSNPQYSGDSTYWTLPITVNIYDKQFDANGIPTHKIATVTQTQSILWRPASDSTCAPTANGTGWKVNDTCYNYSGIASNAIFDLSELHVTLPDDIVVSVAYNTQTKGYTPTGIAGPYNSLNVAVPTDQQVSTGKDNDIDGTLVNSTWVGGYSGISNYGDGGPTGIFRKSTTWAPYGTVALKVTATPSNTAPMVTFNTPTPVNNSFVGGTITGNVTANDDYGMGSYYLRFWKDAFEIASGGTLLNPGSCQSAPGAFLLGPSQTVGCSFDTSSLADGTKVIFSAQFLDGHNVWGTTQRTFTVDNTDPKVIIKTGTGTNDGTLGTNPYSRISFKLNDPRGGLKEAVLNGHVYPRSNEWNDLNWQNIVKSHLVEGGTNTIYVVDRAGNKSEELSFIYDKTAPDAPNLVSPGNDVPINGATPVANKWSEVVDADHYIYESYNVDSAGNQILSPVRWTETYTGIQTNSRVLDDGLQYFWRVKAVDKAGNESEWSELWKTVVDNKAPKVEITNPTGTLYNTNVDVIGTVTDEHPHHYWLNITRNKNNIFPSKTVLHNDSFTNELLYTLTDDGDYVVTLAARDSAGGGTATGNRSKDIVASFTIDKTPPKVTITGHTAVSNVIKPIVDVDASDANNSLTYAWTQTAGLSTGVSISNPNIAEPNFSVTETDSYEFTLTVTDKAGNEKIEKFSFTYTAPVVTLPVTLTPATPPIAPASQTLPTGTGFTNVVPATNNDTGVLGAQTQNPVADDNNAEDSKSILGATAMPKNDNGTGNIAGLSWYWWLLIVAALGGITWWLLAARRRHQDEES